jgi:hypothetical protein
MAEYSPPSVTTWGTISDLTQGNGRSFATDNFTSCVINGKGEVVQTFTGSNGNDSLICP